MNRRCAAAISTTDYFNRKISCLITTLSINIVITIRRVNDGKEEGGICGIGVAVTLSTQGEIIDLRGAWRRNRIRSLTRYACSGLFLSCRAWAAERRQPLIATHDGPGRTAGSN